MNDYTNGEFPVLKPGANIISWTRNVTKVIVRPNWWFYNGFYLPKPAVPCYIYIGIQADNSEFERMK